jgi:uncharacterized protein YggE
MDSMDANKPTRSIPLVTAILLVVVVALASTTLFFSYRTGAVNGSASPNAVKTPSVIPVVNEVPVSGTAQMGDASSSNAITVTGTGEISYIPNEALVQVSVVTDNQTAEEATSTNAAIALNVIRALNSIGILNSSIETQGYSLSANYANCYQSCIPQIIGYSVTNNLVVNSTSSNPTQLGTAVGHTIDTAVKAGANQISLSFSETNSVLAGLTNSALQGAVSSASSQAQAIASSLGVSITGVISSSEGSSYSPQYYGVQDVASSASALSTLTPVIPGSQSMTVSVQVVYSIG